MTSSHPLPPLNALRTFAVAVRHMSFKHAADELCITATAVSHRIRSLEEWLGVKLFNRLTRSLALTKEGVAYASLVCEAFDLLTEASERLLRSSESGELVISTTMSFATNWLTSRLVSFQEEHTDLCVRVQGSDDIEDLKRTNVDVAIRYGEGDFGEFHSECLFTDLVTPVCSPDLATKLSRPEDLLQLPRLDYRWSGFNDRDPSWEKWFRAIGSAVADCGRVPSFSDEHMVLKLALAGRGVALVGVVAAAGAIVEGKLVRPFHTALKNRSYYFVCRPQLLDRLKIRIFQDWLKAQAAVFEKLLTKDPRLLFDTIVPAAAHSSDLSPIDDALIGGHRQLHPAETYDR